MKIGITADLHLASKGEHPERINALVDILQQCKDQGIEGLIICGDLFDASLTNYSEFESVCKRPEFSKIQLLIIPGNHDPNISKKKIVAKNARIFDEPTFESIADGWSGCFVPYHDLQTMGKNIGDVLPTDFDGKWAIVGHGDWFGSLSTPNPYEQSGIYMPLTRKELEVFRPSLVLLGHIHSPHQEGNLYYAGSPCPVATNETGHRRFLTLDTETGKVDERRVNCDVLYFSARLMCMPTKDERRDLERQIEEEKRRWGVLEGDLKRAKIRVEAVGYSNDRNSLVEAVEHGFSGFEFLAPPDISLVNDATDVGRNFLIQEFQEQLSGIDFPVGEEGEPTQEEIVLRAMELVYRRS